MDGCIFCKIVRKEVAAYIFYEDDVVVAFLDINPRSLGMSLVVPKKHYANFDDDIVTSTEVVKRSLLIAKAMKDVLKPVFIDIAIMPSQIPHFHVRLYPIYDFKKDFPLVENKPIEITETQLNELWNKLRGISVEIDEKIEKRNETTSPIEFSFEKEQENRVIATDDVSSDDEQWEWLKKKFAKG